MEVKHGGGRTPGKHHSTNPAMLFATLDVSSVQIPDLEKYVSDEMNVVSNH